MTAARTAGLVCVAVPNQLTRHLDLSDAHLVVDSLAAVDIEHLRGLVAGATDPAAAGHGAAAEPTADRGPPDPAAIPSAS